MRPVDDVRDNSLFINARECPQVNRDKWKVRPRAYKQFLAGKTVALVGPASTLQGNGMGAYIDSHDVVVRLNHSWPLPAHLKADVGARIDVLYHNLNPKKQRFRKADVRQMHRDGVAWVVSTHPALRLRYRRRQRRFRKLCQGLIGFRAVSSKVRRILRPRVGSANGGIVAIVDLLRFPIKRLYVTGFSFYETGYLDYPKYKREFIRNALNHHNQRKHKAFLARLLARDKRLQVDPWIERILARDRRKKRRLYVSDLGEVIFK